VIGGAVVENGVKLLADTEELAVAELSGGAPEHVHRRHLEAFYVLEGELELMLGGERRRAGANTWIAVPAGIPHAVGGSARYLDVHAPGAGFGAFARGERDAFDQE
jgi:quercetin dioxygenase-like cupin family protein